MAYDYPIKVEYFLSELDLNKCNFLLLKLQNATVTKKSHSGVITINKDFTENSAVIDAQLISKTIIIIANLKFLYESCL